MKHIQKKGLRAGQWVRCNAQYVCRNSGVHIADKSIEYATEYFQDKGRLNKGQKLSAEQAVEFETKFGKNPLLYRFSKLDSESIKQAQINFDTPFYLGDFKNTIEAFEKLCNLSMKKNVQVEIHFVGGNSKVLTPEVAERAKKGFLPPRKVSHFSLKGQHENVASVSEAFLKANNV
jgi:hypothetical protein